MRIGHISMFAPNRCGLYEASRDMARADILAGNEVCFFDTGIPNEERKTDQDHRGDFKLDLSNPELVDTCDLIMAHTGVPDLWLARNQVPVVWVLHGRPLACFRPNEGHSYNLLNQISKWQRVRKLVYFWDEFTPYWENILPSEKLFLVNEPVCDEVRFNKTGEIYKEMKTGVTNILICDSVREDICIFDTINSCVYASNYLQGVKFHFCGIDEFKQERYQILFNKLLEKNTLGSVSGRIAEMEKAYRACDIVLSPQVIATRSIIEAIMCGCKIIACEGNRYSDKTWIPNKPETLLEAIMNVEKETDKSNLFFPTAYNERMKELYKEVLQNG